MKSFAQLTPRGQATRLLSLARVALHSYPIEVKRVRLLAKQTNTLFRVDADDGARYVLRVCMPGEHSLCDHQIEAMWLRALADETHISAPHLMEGCDGDVIAHVETAAVPEGRRCMLFTWIPGKPMSQADNLTHYELLGIVLARLHTHAATLIVPEDKRPMRWDKTFYYPSDPIAVYDTAKVHLFKPAGVELIRRAQATIDAELDRLYMHGRPGLIHGDLHTNNVHVHNGKLYVLDFEDVLWGFPAQDIAVTLYSARYHRDDFAEVRDALRHGYEQVAAWPLESDWQLEKLIAARMLMFINYRVHRGGVDLGKYVSGMLARVEAFVHREASAQLMRGHGEITTVFVDKSSAIERALTLGHLGDYEHSTS